MEGEALTSPARASFAEWGEKSEFLSEPRGFPFEQLAVLSRAVLWNPFLGLVFPAQELQGYLSVLSGVPAGCAAPV